VAWHPRFYRFQTCALCHEVLHWEISANISSLRFILLTVFPQLSPMIHDHRWVSEQRILVLSFDFQGSTARPVPPAADAHARSATIDLLYNICNSHNKSNSVDLGANLAELRQLTSRDSPETSIWWNWANPEDKQIYLDTWLQDVWTDFCYQPLN